MSNSDGCHSPWLCACNWSHIGWIQKLGNLRSFSAPWLSHNNSYGALLHYLQQLSSGCPNGQWLSMNMNGMLPGSQTNTQWWFWTFKSSQVRISSQISRSTQSSPASWSNSHVLKKLLGQLFKAHVVVPGGLAIPILLSPHPKTTFDTLLLAKPQTKTTQFNFCTTKHTASTLSI